MQLPNKGLLLREPWASALVEGRKTMELRGAKTAHRGRTAIIRAGTGLVIGEASLVDVRGPFTRSDLAVSMDEHRVRVDWDTADIPYRKTYGWIFAAAVAYEVPTPYRHPAGAVIWVNLGANV